MHKFRVLFGTLVRHYFGLSVLRERLRRRHELWKPAASLLGVLAIGIPFMYGYVKLLQSVYAMSLQLAQPGMIVIFGLLAAQVAILMFGLFYLMSVFYYSSDLEYLVPMPLRPETILAAKFCVVLLTEYVTALPLVVPPLVIFGLRQDLGLSYWLEALLVTAFVPLLPMALAAIVAVLLMRTTSIFRNRDTLRVLAGLVTVAVIMVIQWRLSQLSVQESDPNQVLSGLLAAPNSLVQLIGKRFPPSLWGAQALINSGAAALQYMLYYLGSTLACLALLGVVARRYFYTGLLRGSHASAKRRHRHGADLKLGSRSPISALVYREFWLLVRTPIFAMTAAVNVFLPPFILVLPLLGIGEQIIDMQVVLSSPRFYLWGVISIAALFAAMAPLVAVAPTAISREGRLFWLSQTIPVPPKTQLMAKLIFSVLVASLTAVLMLLVAGFLLKPPVAIFLPGMLLGILALVFTSALSLIIDVVWPRLEWENPQQAMKGNQNVLIAMVLTVALGYVLAKLLLFISKLGWADASILAVAAVALAILTGASLVTLVRLGKTLYLPRYSPRHGQSERLSLGELIRQRGRGVLLSLSIVALVVFGGMQFLGVRNLDYTFGPDSVQFSNVELQYGEITEAQYLEQIPVLSNRVGTSIGKVKVGTFTVRGIGRGKVYANDASQPALLLRTEKTFYIITPENAQERYNEVLAKLK